MTPRRILLAEDNVDHAMLAVEAIETVHGRGVELRVARDGRRALEIVYAEGWTPDLVLLDIQMPEIDGFEVLRRLKEDALRPSIPVVMLTSSSDDRDVCRSYGLGSNSYVAKPMGADELYEVVSRIPSYWLDLNTPAPVADEVTA